MSERIRILAVSRSAEAVAQIAGILESRSNLEVSTSVLYNGHNDPLNGVDKLPDLLILRVNDETTIELQELLARPAQLRAPLIVIAGANDTECMRLAMRAGARDFLPDPVTPDELLAAISRVASEKSGFETDTSDLVTTFIDAKGGSGGSFLAANFAHICQVEKGLSTLLMDLDRQFAALPQYLDIQPSASLFDALRVVDELDAVAVNGFIARHRSGLGVMAGKHGSGASYYEFDANKREHEAIGDLLDILAGTYQRIVVEVPRHLDEIGAAVLKRSDHIVMVVQQNVPAIRDAARLKKILCTDIGVDADCIKVLVNRYQPNLNTELEDMRSALAVEELFTVPNDYKAVSNSIDMGVPIHELARKSPVTTALAKLPDFLSGKQDVRSKGLLTRSLSALLRS